MACQTRFELLAFMLHIGLDRPIFLWTECLNLPITLHDQAKCNGLHAASRFRAGKLPPQHGRKSEANKIIKGTTCAIGINQVEIEFARARHGFGNRRLGNGVKSHAPHIFGKSLFLRQHFLNMPADCFAFAIRVSGEYQAIGFFCLIRDCFELLGLVGIIVPHHFKAVIGINRTILGRQVPYMSIGCEYLVAGAQILLDCLGFCR